MLNTMEAAGTEPVFTCHGQAGTRRLAEGNAIKVSGRWGLGDDMRQPFTHLTTCRNTRSAGNHFV